MQAQESQGAGRSLSVVDLILSVSVVWSLPPATACLEADFVMRELTPYSLEEGEVDMSWWSRGVVQPTRRDMLLERSMMVRPKSKAKTR